MPCVKLPFLSFLKDILHKGNRNGLKPSELRYRNILNYWVESVSLIMAQRVPLKRDFLDIVRRYCILSYRY